MRKQELHPRTAMINKKQKNLAKKERHHALNWLAAVFPRAFDNRLSIQPLKFGIMDDILAHAEKAAVEGISKSKLREAVVIYTRRIDYLTCLKAREMRVDLEGNACTLVTEEEAEQATLKIKKRVEKSAKNARKTQGKISFSSSKSSKATSSTAYPDEQPSMPQYPLRQTAFNAEGRASFVTQKAPVVVTHKVSRAYDPSAVARLKEKLGLSRKVVEDKEIMKG